jgi:hypothetical protein
VAAVAAIVAVRAALSVVAGLTGYLEYNADGYARIVHAAEWAREPRLEVGVWLPLQFWVTGAALWLWPDLAVTPVVINFVAALAGALLLAAIGARLGGAAVGVLTGLLAAAFPWSIWFGLSGLAEAPFAAAVALAGLGLVGWLQSGEGEWGRRGGGERTLTLTLSQRERESPAPSLLASPSPPRSASPLWLAAGALLVSTMLRYEGWFYSVAFVLVVLPTLTAPDWARPRTMAALALPFIFPLIWVGASAAVYGDPFAFASVTSAITAAEGTHETLTAFDRLVFYPVFLATLAWPVVGLAAAGALWRRREPGVVGYALWIVAELAMLALVTSRFSGIGAGRDRYIMSNVVLLLPLAALLIVSLWRWARPGRPLAAAAVALILWFQLSTLLGRLHPYPAPDTVALAADIRTEQAAGRWPAGAAVPVEVAVPGEQDAYNERYALQVLSGRPWGFLFLYDLDLFNRVVADQAPTVWITDARLTNPGRAPGAPAATIGRYTVHRRSPPPTVSVTGPVRPGGGLTVTAGGLQPNEWVGLWLTAADGRTIDLGQAQADASGAIDHVARLPARLAPGAYTLSARGANTGATGMTPVQVSE